MLKILLVMVLTLTFILPGSVAYTTNTSVDTIDTLYVDDDGSADYTRIQDAINAANPGDTIFVYNGLYPENITVDKEVHITGESRSDTIVKINDTVLPSARSPEYYPIGMVTADSVVIESLSILILGDAGNSVYNGFILQDCSNVVIQNCDIKALWMPDLSLVQGGAIKIIGETATTSNNQIIGCDITPGGPYGTVEGITLFNTRDTTISGCTIYENAVSVRIDETSQGTIIENCIMYQSVYSDNGDGIKIFGSENIIVDNDIFNFTSAIRLYGSYNKIVNNDIYANKHGILSLSDNTQNRIINNYFHDAILHGIYIGGTLNTYHHNKFINNPTHAYLHSSVTSNNYWDDGYEGNYWDDFASNPGYPNEYQIGFGNVDHHPLDSWKPAPPQVTVLSPGGEELFGFEVVITYEIADVIGNPLPDATIRVDYNINGGDWIELASGLSNTGEYTWEIPDNSVEDHTKFLIRVGASYGGDTGYGVCDDEFAVDGSPPTVDINRPQTGDIFLFDTKPFSLPLPFALVIGKITLIVDANDNMSGISHVDYEIGEVFFNDTEAPYSWSFNERVFGRRTLVVTAYDMVGRFATDSIELLIINPFGS